MSQDGKRLEALVAFVEKTLVPAGFNVTTNDRVFDDEGNQIAEFDVLVQGKIGTSEFRWLIECRDRPSSGAAPVAWIEQLVGRRTRFHFNKVTAVSTTGFAAGAVEFAQAQAIELREVRALTPEHFADWLEVRYITNVVRQTTLAEARLILDPATPPEKRNAIAALLPQISGDTAVLRSSTAAEAVTSAQAFSAAVSSAKPDPFAGVEPNGEPRGVRLLVRYPDNAHFSIETAAGPVAVKAIQFAGQLRIIETKLPIVYTGEYRDSRTGAPISQIVTYAPQSVMDHRFAIEFHKLAETGETHIALRSLANNA